jgi:hypothetical protein
LKLNRTSIALDPVRALLTPCAPCVVTIHDMTLSADHTDGSDAGAVVHSVPWADSPG